MKIFFQNIWYIVFWRKKWRILCAVSMGTLGHFCLSWASHSGPSLARMDDYVTFLVSNFMSTLRRKKTKTQKKNKASLGAPDPSALSRVGWRGESNRLSPSPLHFANGLPQGGAPGATRRKPTKRIKNGRHGTQTTSIYKFTELVRKSSLPLRSAMEWVSKAFLRAKKRKAKFCCRPALYSTS